MCNSEVQKAVNAAQSLHQRWSELLLQAGGASKEELDWTTNELRNSLRSIEWDLEDLDETINILFNRNHSFHKYLLNGIIKSFLTVRESIVESNPRKFHLDIAEMSKRKHFISNTREIVKVQFQITYFCMLVFTALLYSISPFLITVFFTTLSQVNVSGHH